MKQRHENNPVGPLGTASPPIIVSILQLLHTITYFNSLHQQTPTQRPVSLVTYSIHVSTHLPAATSQHSLRYVCCLFVLSIREMGQQMPAGALSHAAKSKFPAHHSGCCGSKGLMVSEAPHMDLFWTYGHTYLCR